MRGARSLKLLTILGLLVHHELASQVNLVLNPGFETYDTCPTYPNNNLEMAPPWFQPNNPQNYAYGSSDFFHTCSGSTYGVPNNFAGYQWPRTGQGYAGHCLYSGTSGVDGHEYIETALTDTMDTGFSYCFSFYVALANAPLACGTSAMGIYVSNDTCQYVSANYNPLNVQPQLTNDSNNYLMDSVNWTAVYFTYNATGGERYFTVGNFWSGTYNQTNTQPSCSGIPYFYVDDFSVVQLPMLNAGNDIALVIGDTGTISGTISDTWAGMQFEWLPHSGLEDPYSLNTLAHPDSTTTYILTVSCSTCDVPCLSEVTDSVTLFVQGVEPPQSFPFHVPTLFTTDQTFYIDSLQPNTRLKLYDIRGRLIYISENYNNDCALANLSPAIYNYEIELADNRKFTGKFAIVQR